MRFKILRTFILVTAVSFLLWPRSFNHYTYRTPCYTFYDNCGQKEVSPSRKFGGGFDVVCSFVFGAALNKNEGFTITQFTPCVGQHQVYDPYKGHYYTDKDFNILTAATGSITLGIVATVVYLRLRKRRANGKFPLTMRQEAN